MGPKSAPAWKGYGQSLREDQEVHPKEVKLGAVLLLLLSWSVVNCMCKKFNYQALHNIRREINKA